MNMNGMEYFNTSKVSDRITREDLPLVIARSKMRINLKSVLPKSGIRATRKKCVLSLIS